MTIDLDFVRTLVVDSAEPTLPSPSRSAPSKGTTLGMPQRNAVCSVLFLDIVAYSKESVGQQYTIKSRFNELIVGKLAPIPDNQRIALDTGDGVGICFFGDPGDLLSVALDIQRSLAQFGPVKVRMGLHLGPVRILNDMNGHLNVVGDAINTAQRVMGFANDNALLVSKAFYDVVAHLTDGAVSAFTPMGVQTDKHGRQHDLYAASTNTHHASSASTPHTCDFTLPVDLSWLTPEMAAQVEKMLSQVVGPVARVLLKKELSRSYDLASLCHALARHIGDRQSQAQFLTDMGRLR